MRLTCVTCGGLLSNRIAVSEMFLLSSQLLPVSTSDGMRGVTQKQSQNCRYDRISILGLLRSSGQMCKLNQDLVFKDACRAPSWARL